MTVSIELKQRQIHRLAMLAVTLGENAYAELPEDHEIKAQVNNLSYLEARLFETFCAGARYQKTIIENAQPAKVADTPMLVADWQRRYADEIRQQVRKEQIKAFGIAAGLLALVIYGKWVGAL